MLTGKKEEKNACFVSVFMGQGLVSACLWVCIVYKETALHQYLMSVTRMSGGRNVRYF